MENTEKYDLAFFEKFRACCDVMIEKLLREKAAQGLTVVYAHPDGTPYELPASVALENFLAEKKQRAANP